MSDPSQIDRLDAMLSKLERLGKLLLWALALIISGAVWAATIQDRVTNIEAWKSEASPKLEGHAKAIANIEGRLHGLASQVGKVPGRVAAKLEGNQTP